ncbi:metallophosphoesterase [Pusillimonas sp. TS35]|nr:metallophosphoesterase [Pusillimonas sp. TS35]
MRLWIMSDLHLGNGGLTLAPVEADIVILAGDISRPRQAIEWADATFDVPVLYVPGNHEFYGSSMAKARQALQAFSQGTRVHVLDNSETTLLGVRFLGSTLWSDFNLSPSAAARDTAIRQALGLIRDFERIESDQHPGTPFSPDDMEALFAHNRTWLAARLTEGSNLPTVVITHHAPSTRSIHPRFAGSPINACFVSDSEHLLDASRASLWIHGHTHDSFDYSVNGTRVVCNPRGYIRDGELENQAFNPAFTVDVTATGVSAPAIS